MDSRSVLTADAIAARLGARGALCTLIGIVVSGPLALVALRIFAPQPAWQSPAVFAQHYRSVQSLPYVAGFFLIGGYVLLLASLHALARPEQRAAATAGLVFGAMYAALVVFNYLVQTSFLPALAQDYVPARAVAIEVWTMANPRSLAWSIELWGYGCLGIATWLVAPVLGAQGDRGRTAAALFRANGVVSVAGALWTMLEPGWAMTGPGLAAFAAWNLLAFAMGWVAYDVLRAGYSEARQGESTRSANTAPT